LRIAPDPPLSTAEDAGREAEDAGSEAEDAGPEAEGASLELGPMGLHDASACACPQNRRNPPAAGPSRRQGVQGVGRWTDMAARNPEIVFLEG